MIEALEKSALDTETKYIIPMHYYPNNATQKDIEKIRKFLDSKAKVLILPLLAE